MALTRLLDLTADFNAVSPAAVNIDISNWDYVVVQAVGLSGTVTVKATLDAGAIAGTTDGNAISAQNWIAVQGTNLNTGSAVTTMTAAGLVRFGVVGKFMQFSGTGVTITGLFVYLFKIS